MGNNIKNILLKKAEENYRQFSSSLLPDVNNILGIRLPVLRKIAKQLYKSGNYEDFIKCRKFEYFEETMLKGMLIGLLQKKPEEMLLYIKNFINEIDNWSVCDCFCAGLKFTENNRELVWNFLEPYFKSDKEFELRFAYVMLLSYFVTSEYIDKIFEKIDLFKDEKYYSRMSVAWLLSVCFVKEREKTLIYLKHSKLDKWTYNKSLQKICESLRVDKKDKELCKALKSS